MRPLRHRLQTGGLGEVVSAEMLQGVVEAQHEAVRLLEGDHALDWRGLPEHTDLRWAKAAALIEILPVDDTRPISEVPTRVRFSVGFAEQPRVWGGSTSLFSPEGEPTANGWFLDWKLERGGPHSAMLGFRVRNFDNPLPPRQALVDWGSRGVRTTVGSSGGTEGEDVRRADDEGRGIAYLGPYRIVKDGEDEIITITDELRNIAAISLFIR